MARLLRRRQVIRTPGQKSESVNAEFTGRGEFASPQYDEYNPTRHALTHLPLSGSDPLNYGIPLSVGLTNSAGTADDLALSDHIHMAMIPSSAGIPAGVTGQLVYDTTVSLVKRYSGASWLVLGPLTVKEIDGAPTSTGVHTININNGYLTVDPVDSGIVTITVPPAIPAGANREIQFNNAGVFGASSQFLYFQDATGAELDVGVGGGATQVTGRRFYGTTSSGDSYLELKGVLGSAGVDMRMGLTRISNVNYAHITTSVGGIYGVPLLFRVGPAAGDETIRMFILTDGKVGIGPVSAITHLLEVAGNAQAYNFISTIATGTAPYAATSETLNSHLNADLLDGHHASDFAGGGLGDADTVDGLHAAAFLLVGGTAVDSDKVDGFHLDQNVLVASSPQHANLIITAGGDIKPSADSVTAINIAQADGTNFVTFDSINKRLGVNVTPAAPIDVYQSTLGSEIARLESNSTQKPTYRIYQNVVTTYNAVPTILHTIAIDNDTAYLIEGRVISRGGAVGNKQVAAIVQGAVFRQNGGNATLLGTVYQPFLRYTTVGVQVTITVSGTDARIVVTGRADEVYEWHGTIIVQKIYMLYNIP